MRTRRGTALLAAMTATATVLLGVPAADAAEGSGTPEMCSGRSDPGMRLNAHAHGNPKFILNLETDAAGAPTGVLILGRGSTRIEVEDLCRFWQHIPGQEPGGSGEDVDEGATTAHAVGVGLTAAGTRVLVRADVRENEEGRFFRVRYRVMGQHGEAAPTPAAEDGHDDESWTRVPAEGWAPLDSLNLR